MQILDRILDRDDVGRAGGVDVIDHRRERRALAASRGSSDEHESALFLRDRLEHRWQSELVERLDADRDHAKRQPDGAPLLKDVAAKSADARKAVSEIDFLRLAELLSLIR